LLWFLLKDHAKTTPSLRIVATQRSSGADLKVKRKCYADALTRAKKDYLGYENNVVPLKW